jgi:hypothetical protein
MLISRSYWIAAPPDEIFEELDDPAAMRVVTPWVHKFEVLPEGPLAAGKKLRTTYRRGLLIRRAQDISEILCYDPPRVVRMATKGWGWKAVTTRTFTPDGEGTRIKTVIDADLAPLCKPLKPLISALMHWNTWVYHRNIRIFIETDAAVLRRRWVVSLDGGLAGWVFFMVFIGAFIFVKCV